MNIQNIIYLILAIVIIALSITIAVKNSKIDNLQAEVKALNLQIASCESNIKLQNAKITEMSINQKQAELGIIEANDNYKLAILKYKEELRNIPEQNGFLYNVEYPVLPKYEDYK